MARRVTSAGGFAPAGVVADVGAPAGAVAEGAVQACTLCDDRSPRHLEVADARRYLDCTRCGLIFMHPDDRLRPLAEIRRYQEHRNSGEDPGYVQFLRRLGDWIEARVPVGSRGIDYGCGPAPVLGDLLSSSGRPTVSYDPLFNPLENLLDERYDFVTCCEVAEHAHSPRALLERLDGLVRPGGLIGLMTRLYGFEAPFATWWYRRDPTHVSFYRPETMEWIGREAGWLLELPAPNVVLFRVRRGRVE